MALFHVNFHSEILGMDRSMAVILPERNRGIAGAPGPSGDKYPVLWLLHGRGDDHTAFVRHTSIERLVAGTGLAVVMPSVDGSYYTNMAHGGRYFDFIAEELPRIVAEWFPVSRERSDNFLCGISMGGYGAMKIGLSMPSRYASIGCLSGANMVYRNYESTEWRRQLWMSIYGTTDVSTLQGTRHDLYALAQEARLGGGPLPRIYHACGTEDPAHGDALHGRDFFRSLDGNPFDYEFHDSPGGHTWDYWDPSIKKYLGWLGYCGT